VIVSVVAVREASAKNPAMTFEYVSDAGTFNGNQYMYVEGFMTGTIDRGGGVTGNYKIPIVMYYPKSVAGNNVGIVELTNSGFFIFTRDKTGNLVACGRGDEFTDCPSNDFRVFEKWVTNWVPLSTEGYLWRNGYTYLAVQWNKAVTDQMGPNPPDGLVRRRSVYGTIEKSTDAFEIMRDGARWLRKPTTLTANGAPPVHAMSKLLSFGWSNGTAVQRKYLLDGGNKETGGSLIYDGFFLYAIGAPCWIFDDMAPVFGNFMGCPGNPPSAGAKILSIDTTTDMELFSGVAARDPNFGTAQADPNFVRWELAGVEHIAPLILDEGYKGAAHENPVNVFPIQRGAWANLTAWVVNGTPPAPTALMQGSPDAMFNLVPVKNADGNELGGIQLPHLAAPTGVYDGVDYTLVMTAFLNSLGGRYDRWSDDVLMQKYPTPQAWKDKYNAQAEALFQAKYIVQEDRDMYVAATPDIPDAPPPKKFSDDSGCSVAGGGGVASPFLLGMIVAGGLLRRRRSRTKTALAMLAGLVAVGQFGCSGDSSSKCVGHACPNSPINLPEGGEVRLELVYQANRAPEVRTYAWFASDQDPETRPWSRDPKNWNIQDGTDLCMDLRTGIFFPSGVPHSRTEIDAGASVRYINTTDSNDVIQLNKQMNTRDLVFDMHHDILYMNEPVPSLIVPGADYDFEIDGGSGIPAQTVADALHMPQDTKLTFPVISDHITFPRNQDFRFFWDTTSENQFDYAFVSFTDLYGPVGYCIGPQSGYMTIPFSFIQMMPQSGNILHGLINHNAVKRDSDGRKFDFLGVNCRQIVYQVDPGI